MLSDRIEIFTIPGIPLISTGDDLAAIILLSLEATGLSLEDGDILIITSKIVSKAEGRWVNLAEVTTTKEDLAIADLCGKDPREVAVIMSEAKRVSRYRQNVLIVEHRLGFVCANAGVDHSNTRKGGDWRLLLPENPDQSASEIRRAIQTAAGKKIGIVISDSHGRPFRMGTVGVAIGSAGLPALRDLRGQPDLFGTALQVTETGFADEIAAAAGLLQGQAGEGRPVVIIRGLTYPLDEAARASDLVRPAELDLFR